MFLGREKRFQVQRRCVEAEIDRANFVLDTLRVVTHALLSRALSEYSQHADKSWGLVDCASFLVMRDLGISEAFTSDSHFEQAGFKVLLNCQ